MAAAYPTLPYFETSRYRVLTMVELANPEPTDLVADLGSGDGRITIAFAQKGIKTIGFELDKVLVKDSRDSIEEIGLQNLARIEQRDFWKEDVSLYSIVAIYPMPDIMELLEKKLKKELKPGSKILTNYYTFKSLKLHAAKNKVYLYSV